MAWRSRSSPYYRPGHVQLGQQRPAETFGRCPAALVDKLSVNGLLPDEATERQGNCGIDAFARSFTAQMGKGPSGAGQTGCARNRRNLQRAPDKVALLRRVGVSWLEANASEVIWPGMTVAKLCSTVSGWSFQEYVAKMRQDKEWVDTAFLHALGRAHGANVLIFQAHSDEALVGEDMMEDPGDESDAPMMVPIALVNDHHFWGVVECLDDIAVAPVDKGEFAVFQSRVGLGLCPDSGGQTAPRSKAGLGLCPDSSGHTASRSQAGLGRSPDSSGHAASRSQAGLGLCPDSSGHTAQDHAGGLEDGEQPDLAFPPASAAPTDDHIAVELELCVALARWEPWSTPSAELVQAMERVQRVRGVAPATVDMATTCLRRAEAITEMAYEEAHFEHMPESYRYQRLARMRLRGCPQWGRRARGRNHLTSRYMSVCAGMQSVAVLSQTLDEGNCARHNKAHGPGNAHCRGMAGLSANMVYNWRVLWWSLPLVQRREHVLHFFVSSLHAHRASGMPDERWRVQYTFLGMNVCRDAFIALAGFGSSTLQAARGQSLEGKVSWSSRAERGMHGGMLGNTNKPAAYLGARQWLEWYAESHAECSPMDGRAYLPAGRKAFYYAHYRKDILERHGVTEADAKDARAYALASSRSKRRRLVGAQAGGSSADAGAYVPASCRMADVPLAELNTFLRAWRIECPWLIVCKSVSMFTRCSVCEYLRLLIDQTPRDQEALRSALQARLGDHYEFQAAQRLAHGRLEELCAQSGGAKWLMLIDKMDQSKTVCPTVWSQLATKLFQDQEKRLITGLIGSMWFGTTHTAHHVRTVFNDCSHGSEMQSSAILLNLHEVAKREGHLPQEFHIGADNTPKETKNQYTFWFLIWMLCALEGTPLTVISVVFLMVGHTHNKLDRLFSRISVALRGKDYFTVEGMLRQVRETLRYTLLHSSHLAQVWRWKALAEGDMPGGTRRMHNLAPAHAFRFSLDNGIWMQWKQWTTDEAWSQPVQLLSRPEAVLLGQWRPAEESMEFPSGGQPILDWAGRLEAWCESQPAGSEYLGLRREFAWLRAAIHHTLPGTYAPGTQVDDILRDLRALPHTRPGACAPSSQCREFPQDIIAQLYPGADVPNLPHDALVRIDGVTHTAVGNVVRSNVLAPGSYIIMAAPHGTKAHGQELPIVVGQVVDTSSKKGVLVVAWYLPQLARMENFRGGQKKQIVDVFGPWMPVDEIAVEALRKCCLPDAIVQVQSVLEANFNLTADLSLPYDVLDAMRARHSIDLTGFNLSMTRRGNMYRSYVLMRGV